jgi:hypothetical protein
MEHPSLAKTGVKTKEPNNHNNKKKTTTNKNKKTLFLNDLAGKKCS